MTNGIILNETPEDGNYLYSTLHQLLLVHLSALVRPCPRLSGLVRYPPPRTTGQEENPTFFPLPNPYFLIPKPLCFALEKC